MPEILDDLERKTGLLIGSPDLRKQLGDRGRRLVEERYEWRVLTARLSSLLLELTAK